MKHPVRSDFDAAVTEAGVNVTFKPTNSIYSFYRVADTNIIARLGPASFAGVQHEGRDTEDYPSDEVQDLAQEIASEHARSIWSVQDEALAGIRSETINDITPLRTVSLTGVPQRIASEVAATLRLIQNLDKAD
jgi:hypothetical protein